MVRIRHYSNKWLDSLWRSYTNSALCLNRYHVQIGPGLELDFPSISLSAHFIVAGKDSF